MAVRGDARRLVEQLPAAKILLDIGGEFGEEPLDADGQHQLHHAVDADEGDDGKAGRLGHAMLPEWLRVGRSMMRRPIRLAARSTISVAVRPRSSRNGLSS